MAYVTPGQLRAVLLPTGGAAPATEDKATPASMTDAQLAQSISDAETIVDAMLCARYVVPFELPAPKVITMVTAACAIYLATLTFRKTTDLEQRDPAAVRWSLAKNMLEQIASGEMCVPGVNPLDTMTGASVINTYTGDLWALGDFDTREVEHPPGWH